MCRKSAVLINPDSDCSDCESCGWNPPVALARRRKIREYSARGLLYLWGVDFSTAEPEDIERKRRNLYRLSEAMKEGGRW